MEKMQILEDVLKCKNIKKLDKRVFLKAWRAVFFLFPGLHPDDACGWPKRLAFEAFRRLEIGELTENELYCYKEAMKGLEARRKNSRRNIKEYLSARKCSLTAKKKSGKK